MSKLVCYANIGRKLSIMEDIRRSVTLSQPSQNQTSGSRGLAYQRVGRITPL
jgi:hypothetical protein